MEFSATTSVYRPCRRVVVRGSIRLLHRSGDPVRHDVASRCGPVGEAEGHGIDPLVGLQVQRIEPAVPGGLGRLGGGLQRRPAQGMGGSQTMASTGSLHILWQEMSPGDMVLAYQTDLRAAVGLCEVDDLVDYVDEEGEPQRDMMLRPVESFAEPVKLHELKRTDPVLAGARALRPGWPQTLYATTPEEARALLTACNAKFRLPEAVPGAARSTKNVRGGGFASSKQTKAVEVAAVKAVRAAYERDGWTVTSIEDQKIGYDLIVRKAGREEHLEVKGTRAIEPSFIITAGEVRCLRTDPAARLCVVTGALSPAPTLHSWKAEEVERAFVLSPMSFWARQRHGDDREG
jgi:Domain of unknown function (DUF3883)